MRSVFDQSWKLLAEDEQQTFERLSVFRGGFWARSGRTGRRRVARACCRRWSTSR
ncbi:MAG: hypothetical protein IPK19_27340 [Chloroflexi bacterium]|nr:hypothetical protein [Chloroflexota bacterium]